MNLISRMHKTSLFLITLLTATGSVQSAESTCYGTTAKGYLENGIKLPSDGTNFTSYSKAAEILGRTYVHSKVKKIIVEAYRALETEQPGKIFKYAESGFKNGGKFKPHKTHQNGLSVDFMTPVLDSEGRSVHLPTHALNRWGYDIEFNSKGEYEGLQIDYEALAAHIIALHKAARANGANLWRVIFDPKLQPRLYRTKYSGYLKKYITFTKRRSWVRHDEHYHVDFKIRCRKLPG